MHQKQVVWAWTFLAVPIVFYVVIRFWPTFEAFWLSFTDWNLLRRPAFIGVANYLRLLARSRCSGRCSATPSSTCSSARRSACLVAFFIAYHLDRVRFMHGFIRALYFLPFLTTAAAMAWVWRWFYQPVPIGMINDVLSNLGLPQQPFLRSTTQALPAVLAPAIWAGLGFQIVIFMAGLRAIPSTYYEAARIDGVVELDDPRAGSRCRCSSRPSCSSSYSPRSASCGSSIRSTT